MKCLCAMLEAGMSRAAVFQGAGLPFTVEAVEPPCLAPGEVLVDILCATICASDLHTHAGRRGMAAPMVLGHEMVGRVTSAPDAPGLAGQRVVWPLVWHCGACFFCERGLPQACEHLRKFGHDTAPLMGGFAEQCRLPAGTRILPVPATLPDELASLAMCAGATAAAIVRAAAPERGEVALVYGAGPLGLTVSAMSTDAGARVLLIEPDARRREAAPRFGARTRDVLPARGADVAFELSGQRAAAEAALAALRKGGRLILAGGVFPGEPPAWSTENIIKRHLSLRGVYNYAPEDLETALAFMNERQHHYPFASLIERRFALDQINEAFAHAHEERPWRVAVYP
jgi:alcohol dehydrogenase